MAGSGRATAVTESSLAATASALQRRADELLDRARAISFTRDQIALVALAASDAITWLVEAGTDGDRLREIETSLTAQSAKLDELEDLFRAR
jgi:anti-sigma regulatory factor (Ser/Thr protein kinase)